MDCRSTTILCIVAVLVIIILNTEARNKKVVIHVPYNVKKIKHTHTVYKTIHHHHTHPESHTEHGASTEEHEHFHHMHIHNNSPTRQHSPAVSEIGSAEFLPDAPMEEGDIPVIPLRVTGSLFSRPLYPIYRRN